jgi:DNA-binding XRE family transcriptional regulator
MISLSIAALNSAGKSIASLYIAFLFLAIFFAFPVIFVGGFIFLEAFIFDAVGLGHLGIGLISFFGISLFWVVFFSAYAWPHIAPLIDELDHTEPFRVVSTDNIASIVNDVVSMDLKKAMATNLLRVRHAKGFTQEDLAERAGLSVRYLGSVERAAVSANVTVLAQLARGLGVDACELIRSPPRR